MVIFRNPTSTGSGHYSVVETRPEERKREYFQDFRTITNL
jgi:hypothetical protein